MKSKNIQHNSKYIMSRVRKTSGATRFRGKKYFKILFKRRHHKLLKARHTEVIKGIKLVRRKGRNPVNLSG